MKSTFYYEEIGFNQFLFIGFHSKKNFSKGQTNERLKSTYIISQLKT